MSYAIMDTETMIRYLRGLETEHKNDCVGFGKTNWSMLCHDVAEKMEELHTELKAYKEKYGGLST